MADEKIDFDSSVVEDNGYVEELPGSNSKFLKVPEVGESIELEIKGIQEDKKPKRLSKEGKEFHTGFKTKAGEIISYDIITTDGSKFNLKGAMLYYGVGNALNEYKKKHPGLKPSYLDAKIQITHAFDGSHANMKLSDLQKIKGFDTLAQATEYQNNVKLAMKEFRIYNIKLLN